jgi:hypothetical protein
MRSASMMPVSFFDALILTATEFRRLIGETGSLRWWWGFAGMAANL